MRDRRLTHDCGIPLTRPIPETPTQRRPRGPRLGVRVTVEEGSTPDALLLVQRPQVVTLKPQIDNVVYHSGVGYVQELTSLNSPWGRGSVGGSHDGFPLSGALYKLESRNQGWRDGT